MDNNVVTITNTKDNTLEFTLHVQGLREEGKPLVRFVIKTEGVCLTYPCNMTEEGKWEVVIVKAGFFERTTYNFFIEVIADGYYFEPLSGTVNVVGSPELYSTKPQNITFQPIAPSPSDVVVIANPATEPTKTNKIVSPISVPAGEIAQQIMQSVLGGSRFTEGKRNKKGTSRQTSVRERITLTRHLGEPKGLTEKDKKVKEILRESGRAAH